MLVSMLLTFNTIVFVFPTGIAETSQSKNIYISEDVTVLAFS